MDDVRHLDIPEGIPRDVRDRETEATKRKCGGRGKRRDGWSDEAGLAIVPSSSP